MKYEVDFHVIGKGIQEKCFDHRPTEDELVFLVERTDIDAATLWKKSGSEWVRVYDIL